MIEGTRAQLRQAWLDEEKFPFEGWDFSHLDGRMIDDEIPWSYDQRAVELMAQATSLLDMETGGGERLLSLRKHWPPQVAVTEGYPPNAALVTERLGPLGVQVAAVDGEHEALPFDDGSFDLITNRHGWLPEAEIARVLAPDGVLLTKQISPMWAWDLVEIFDVETALGGATPEDYTARFETLGLTVVDVKDWRGKMRFTDVGAIVYYLKAIPWTVPGFSVKMHLEQLFALQARLDSGQELAFEIGSFLIEACKNE